MKAGAVDAKVNFLPAEVAEMEELLKVNQALKELDKKKKGLVEKVKQHMILAKISAVDVDGKTISLTESTRRTVSAETKNEFIGQLINKGMKHLVLTTIEPDLDGVFTEVDTGNLDENFVNQYVKVTPVLTLRCSN